MDKLTFECETITPMFLAGADGKTPELRSPSIKGTMRFWWRAINAHLSLDDLRKKESEIFGGSGDNEGRSKVVIKIDKTLNYDGYKSKPVPHKTFSLSAFKEKEMFKLSMHLNKVDDFSIEKLKSLFILTSILGGFGKRSRRGFGSIKIKKIDNQDFSFDYSLESILNQLNIIHPNNFKIGTNKIIRNKPASLDAKYAYIKEIEIGKTNTNLLLKISEASHDNNSDYTGFASGNSRLASPIYVSLFSNSNSQIQPIITTLNIDFGDSRSHGTDKSPDFKKGVL